MSDGREEQADFGQWELEHATGMTWEDFLAHDETDTSYTPRFDPPASLIFEQLTSDEADLWRDTLLQAWDELRDDAGWSRWFTAHIAPLKPEDGWMIAFGEYDQLNLTVDRRCAALDVPITDGLRASDLDIFMRGLLLTFFDLLADAMKVPPRPQG